MLTDDENALIVVGVAKQIGNDNYIVPKSVVRLWAGALLLELAGVGITSLVSFKDAVVYVSKEAATNTANDVAEKTAMTIADKKANDIVNEVFASAITAAEHAGVAAAQQAVTDEVNIEARKAANDAVTTFINRTGENIINTLQQDKADALASLSAIHAVEVNINKQTLVEVDARLNALEKDYGRILYGSLRVQAEEFNKILQGRGSMTLVAADRKIVFNPPFDSPPIVVVGLSRVESDGGRPSEAKILEVTSQGATIRFFSHLGGSLTDAFYVVLPGRGKLKLIPTGKGDWDATTEDLNGNTVRCIAQVP